MPHNPIDERTTVFSQPYATSLSAGGDHRSQREP